MFLSCWLLRGLGVFPISCLALGGTSRPSGWSTKIIDNPSGCDSKDQAAKSIWPILHGYILSHPLIYSTTSVFPPTSSRSSFNVLASWLLCLCLREPVLVLKMQRRFPSRAFLVGAGGNLWQSLVLGRDSGGRKRVSPLVHLVSACGKLWQGMHGTAAERNVSKKL